MNNLITLKLFTDSDINLLKKWIYKPPIALWYEEPISWINEVKNRNGEFNFIHH